MPLPTIALPTWQLLPSVIPVTVTLLTDPPAPLNQMPYNAALPQEPTGWVCVNPVPMIVRFSTFIDVAPVAFDNTAPLKDPSATSWAVIVNPAPLSVAASES